MSKAGHHVLNLDLPPELADALRGLARAWGIQPAQLARLALAAWVQQPTLPLPSNVPHAVHSPCDQGAQPAVQASCQGGRASDAPATTL